MPLPHNLFDYCSIRKSNFIEKYLVVKRKISFVYKADILLTKLIIRGALLCIIMVIVVLLFFLRKLQVEIEHSSVSSSKIRKFVQTEAILRIS